MEQKLIADYGEFAFTPPVEVRFRKDGWPDRRFKNAALVHTAMKRAIGYYKNQWEAGLL